MKGFLIIISLLIFNSPLNAQIIPPYRCIKWQPGIPGGIPVISSPVLDIVDFGADPSGKQDSYPALARALENLPESGGVIFIPEGNFKIESALRINRNNVVFRGTGVSSKLYMGNYGNSVIVEKNIKGSWQPIINGFTKGSEKISVDNTSEFTAGQFAEVEQENDPQIMYTDPEWDQSWSENSIGQIFQVEATTGKDIILKTPLHIDFDPKLNARIRPVEMIKNIGFENLYIEKTIANGHTFLFTNAAYCWIDKVESYKTRRSHVMLDQCLACTVSMSYFHHSFDYGGGGSGYGIECNRHTTGVLTENNVFDSLRHAMLVQVGANGNVFAYNFSANPVQGDGEENLNQGWIPNDISIHGHYPFMNLFECNVVEEIGIGDYWGPAGPGNTYFRNKVNGEGIFIYDHSHSQNIIANETKFFTDENSKSNDLIFHGNVLNNVITWDPDLEKKLPPSLYLDTFPGFFFEEYWPMLGPDVLRPLKLPAQVRYEYGHPTFVPGSR